jgi:glutathione peroxidase
MATATDPTQANSIYEFKVKDLDGNEVSLDKYTGHPTLIVNVATFCGFTKSNYKQLNELYTKHKDEGLRIAAFPCNQFNNQEPGCEVDLKEFIKKNDVEFDVYNKINVNGNNADPLYQFLKKKQGGFLIDAIKWNFTKFLVDKDGKPVARYSPNTEPNKIEKDIVPLLK